MKRETSSYTLFLTRVLMGWIFLWAFLDKCFGLGFATTREKAWIYGGSPTSGFLTNAVKGPFASFYHTLAGSSLVDWLFMIGLLFLGVSLILGIFNKLATYSGVILFALMYLALIPPDNNPFVDDHIIYILVLLLLNMFKAGECFGLRKIWAKSSLVKKFPYLE